MNKQQPQEKLFIHANLPGLDKMFSKYGEHLGNNIFMFDEDVYYAMIKEEKKTLPGMSWEDTVILNGYATEKELKEYYDSFNVKGFYLPLNDTEWYNTIDDF